MDNSSAAFEQYSSILVMLVSSLFSGYNAYKVEQKSRPLCFKACNYRSNDQIEIGK